MYNDSPNSPFFTDHSVFEAIQSITEASNKLEDDILSFLYVNGKTDPSVLAGTFEIPEREVQRMLKSMEMRNLVKASASMAIPTPEGKNYALKQNPTLKSVRRESVELDEAKLSKDEQRAVAKFIDYLKAVGSPGKYRMPPGVSHMTKDEVMSRLKNGFGLSDVDITKLKIGRMKPSEVVKESTELKEASSDIQQMETLLYVIMAEGDHRRGETPWMAKNDLEREMVNQGIPNREVAVTLAKAEKIGFIKQDGVAIELTDKALKFIQHRES